MSYPVGAIELPDGRVELVGEACCLYARDRCRAGDTWNRGGKCYVPVSVTFSTWAPGGISWRIQLQEAGRPITKSPA